LTTAATLATLPNMNPQVETGDSTLDEVLNPSGPKK
jgi:hypothetical protein